MQLIFKESIEDMLEGNTFGIVWSNETNKDEWTFIIIKLPKFKECRDLSYQFYCVIHSRADTMMNELSRLKLHENM